MCQCIATVHTHTLCSGALGTLPCQLAGCPRGELLCCVVVTLGVGATRCFTFCPVNEKRILLLERRRDFSPSSVRSAAPSMQEPAVTLCFDRHLLPWCWVPTHPPAGLQRVEVPSL